jgi:hypothetical protein
MTIYRWRDRRDVIARFVSEHDIPGILKRDVVLNPGEAAMVVVKGKIQDVVTQTELKDIGGGFINWFKRKVGMESAVQLLFLVTTPIQLEIPLEYTTKDYQPMKGTGMIRFQFTTTEAQKVINLIQRDQVITLSSLEDRIKDEIFAMVFSNVIAKHDSAEFHGNIDIQKEMEATATVELRKTLGLWGLNLIKMFSVWQENAYDELMKYKAELKIYDGEQDSYHLSMMNNINRQHEYELKVQETEWDLKLGDIKGEERITTERFLADLERDRARFNEEVRREREQIEVDKERRKSHLETDKDRMEMEMERDREEMDIAMDSFERVQAAKRERMKLEQDFKKDQMEVQTSSTEKLMEKAIDAGVADSESLQEMMRQQTMQKMADRESDKVEALAEAEGKRYEQGAYIAAEDRERDYETKRMDLSAKQMEAAKQNVPKTYVSGASSTPTVTHVSSDDEAAKITCPHCKAPIQEGWKACPACGSQL